MLREFFFFFEILFLKQKANQNDECASIGLHTIQFSQVNNRLYIQVPKYIFYQLLT